MSESDGIIEDDDESLFVMNSPLIKSGVVDDGENDEGSNIFDDDEMKERFFEERRSIFVFLNIVFLRYGK